MNQKQLIKAHVDKDGNVIIPQEIASRFGLVPNIDIFLDEGNNEIRILRPVTHLAKVYIEPTNLCNLDCRTCMRNVWGEPSGSMSDETFERIFASIQKISPIPTIFFGGFGEPLIHPRIIEWIKRFKSIGAKVELITNALLSRSGYVMGFNRWILS